MCEYADSASLLFPFLACCERAPTEPHLHSLTCSTTASVHHELRAAAFCLLFCMVLTRHALVLNASVCFVSIDLQHLELCMHSGFRPMHTLTGRDSAFISLRVSTHLCWQVLLQHLHCSATQQRLSVVASRVTAGLCNCLSGVCRSGTAPMFCIQMQT